jgi:hypothetical protein
MRLTSLDHTKTPVAKNSISEARIHGSLASPGRSLPEFFGNDDGIEPYLNIAAAIFEDHLRLWILDRNSQQIAKCGGAPALVEVTPQYMRGLDLLVPENQRLHHFRGGLFTNSMFRKVLMK